MQGILTPLSNVRHDLKFTALIWADMLPNLWNGDNTHIKMVTGKVADACPRTTKVEVRRIKSSRSSSATYNLRPVWATWEPVWKKKQVTDLVMNANVLL